MMHGDNALTSRELIEIGHACTIQPSEQTTARPRRIRLALRVGYARITGNQADLHHAVNILLGAGVQAADIHTDYGPQALSRHREGLRRALQQVVPGDTLVVTSLVTLARSKSELGHLLDTLDRREIVVQIGRHALADVEPAGISVMTTAIHDQLLADIQAARAAARAAQVGRGAMPWTLTPQQTVEVIEAFDAGQPRRQIATKYAIGLSTVFRVAN